MKKINSMVFGMAALVLMAGCSGVPKVKDVSGPSEIIEHKGTIFGVAQPEWVSEVLEAPDQKSLKKALGIDRHIWVISKTGENLDFIKNWADQVDARAEISASIQQGVADFTGARMQGEDSDVEETIERYSARASNIIISGLNKETDWWVRGYTRVQKKNEQEALKRDAEQLGAFVPVLLVGGDEAAHVDEGVFLGTHRHAVGITEHLLADLLQGLVGIAFLTRLDEVGILDETGAIDVDRHTIFVAEFAGLADVLHAHRLTADGVVGDSEDKERHVALVLLQYLLEFLEADITLERHFQLGVVSLGHGDVDGKSLAAFNVTLGSIEVGIARDDLTGFHQIAEQHVFSGTALVSGDNILETSEFCDGILHVVEGAGTAVALIAHHHGTPLTVAHRARTRVGQQVNVNIVALQHENVVVRFKKPLFSFFSCGFLDGLHHLDFPRFCKR